MPLHNTASTILVALCSSAGSRSKNKERIAISETRSILSEKQGDWPLGTRAFRIIAGRCGLASSRRLHCTTHNSHNSECQSNAEQMIYCPNYGNKPSDLPLNCSSTELAKRCSYLAFDSEHSSKLIYSSEDGQTHGLSQATTFHWKSNSNKKN